MTLSRFVVATILLAHVALATAAVADCVLPKAPPATPSGASATAAQMEAARVALERYQKGIKDYLGCKEQDTKVRIAGLGTNVEAIRQIKMLEEKRTKGLQDEIQTRADEFDEQLRAYKLVNRE
jgi:hypothetical protein